MTTDSRADEDVRAALWQLTEACRRRELRSFLAAYATGGDVVL